MGCSMEVGAAWREKQWERMRRGCIEEVSVQRWVQRGGSARDGWPDGWRWEEEQRREGERSAGLVGRSRRLEGRVGKQRRRVEACEEWGWGG